MPNGTRTGACIATLGLNGSNKRGSVSSRSTSSQPRLVPITPLWRRIGAIGISMRWCDGWIYFFAFVFAFAAGLAFLGAAFFLTLPLGGIAARASINCAASSSVNSSGVGRAFFFGDDIFRNSAPMGGAPFLQFGFRMFWGAICGFEKWPPEPFYKIAGDE